MAADDEPLDNPIYAALRGPHRALARVRGRALRYPAEYGPFLGLPDEPSAADWRDAQALVPDGVVGMMRLPVQVPASWTVPQSFAVVQMVCEPVGAAAAPEVVRLSTADVAEMTALVAATNPGPFFSRTVELGAYHGIRRDGELIAMAGERMHLTGWTEVSAVCTAASARGQGLASTLVRAVLAGIEARGERAFLHAATSNTTAISVYETIGFRLRRELSVLVLTPGA
jgi:ribosomal protein S18 acetylase RimI-like enzyme